MKYAVNENTGYNLLWYYKSNKRVSNFANNCTCGNAGWDR